MALREKTDFIDQLEADLLIVQECEDPSRSNPDFLSWSGNYLWVGKTKHKGLAIFARGDVELCDWNLESVTYFLPCQVGNELNIVGVWTKRSQELNYLGQLWRFLNENEHQLRSQPTLIFGDFNSSAIWDHKYGAKSHTNLIERFQELGFESVYHAFSKEAQGKETKPTYFMYRDIEKPYHIDHAICSTSLLNSIKKIEIGKPKDWINYSDHMPVSLEISI